MTTNTTTNTEQQTSQTTQAEPSMAEYAAMREAEMRGEKPVQATPAAAVDTTTDAAATEGQEDQSAAATTGDEIDGKTATESATEEGQESTAPAKKGKKGINERFSELTAEKKEAEALAAQRATELEQAKREAEEARAEAERLRIEADRAHNAIPKVPDAADDPAPNRTDFDDPDEYVAALSAHTTRQEIRRASEAAKQAAEARAEEAKKAADEARQAEVQKSIQELHTTFNQRVSEAKSEYPDYDEKVSNNESLVLRNDVFFSIERAKDAPHILYHLSDHPEIAEELNLLSPYDAAIRIGEMQAELRIARKPKPSKAAEPIRPVGSRQSPLPKSPNEESMEEYAARREKELSKASREKRTRII